MADVQHSIFIGYRRDDTADASGRVFDRLHGAFGAGQVFKDVDNLPVGVDFGEHILTILPRCSVFLAMIGPGWTAVRDEAGARRLDSPKDWVRIELETALATPGLQVVPVLINGAPMPHEEELPPSLARLVRLNAAIVRRDPDFHKDMDKLIAALRSGLASGRVVVEVAPEQALSGSAAAWKVIEGSLDPHDYVDFERHFPGTPEVMLASRCRRQLETWAATDKTNVEAIVAFLATRPFTALAELANEAKAARERAAQEAFEQARRERKAREEEERRAQLELEQRFGPYAVRARAAALSGGPVAQRIFRVELVGLAGWPTPEAVVIPPGRFLMGSPSGELAGQEGERPQREVEIRYPFAVGRGAVTFAEWDAAVAGGADLPVSADEGWGGGARPVINVSWEDAQAYLAWLNERLGLRGEADAWRLLSEAEWEYAARAGTTTPFNFGETISTSQANYDGSRIYGNGLNGKYRGKTTPVGTFPANAFGLYDMHGNTYEWLQDCYAETYSAGQPSDGRAHEMVSCSLRSLRGGSWISDPRYLRSANRGSGDPKSADDSIGFRIARTLSAGL